MEQNIVIDQALTITLIIIVVAGMRSILKMMDRLMDSHTSLGSLVLGHVTNKSLKEDFFTTEARVMQNYLERFLGHGYNVQCNFISAKEGGYHLWVWKKYETREMGCNAQALSPALLLECFMHLYYSSPYFTDAMAFPDKD